MLKMLQLNTNPENIVIYLFTEYAYLWKLQTILPVYISVVHTPLCTTLSKRGNYILIARVGNYFQNANYGAAIFWMQAVQQTLSPSIRLESWWRHNQVAPWYVYFHLIDARATLERFPACISCVPGWIIIIIIIWIKYFSTLSQSNTSSLINILHTAYTFNKE